jgi:hypothetical protein
VYVRDFGRLLGRRMLRERYPRQSAALDGIYLALLRSFFFWGVAFVGRLPCLTFSALALKDSGSFLFAMCQPLFLFLPHRFHAATRTPRCDFLVVVFLWPLRAAAAFFAPFV